MHIPSRYLKLLLKENGKRRFQITNLIIIVKKVLKTCTTTSGCNKKK